MQFFLTNLVVVNELEVLDRSNILTILIDNKNLVKGVVPNCKRSKAHKKRPNKSFLYEMM